jgi:hypothetical protein
MRLSYAVLFAAALGGCSSSTAIDIRYHLKGLAPADVVRVDTMINVDPSDARMFYADQPYREVAQGVGYTVHDLQGTGALTMMIEFDATLGYQFQQQFDFNLLPPVGESPPKLILASRAMGRVDAISNTAVEHAAFGDGPVDVTLMDTRCAGKISCPANEVCCNNGCLATDSDVNNCGGCGATCGASGDGCSGGKCRCGGGSACIAGQTCCAGLGCIDLMNDAFHCGTCGHACNPGESCVNGACACGSGAACTGTSPVCCVSGASALCSATGTCACGASICTSPEICCGGSACKNLMTDNANCGMCGHGCITPLSCSGGACACNGQICSTGDTCCGTGCANLKNDPSHCGTCDKQCATNEICSGGKCLCGTTQCSTGQTCCGTTCVNTSSDLTNCGTCGHSCNRGEQCANSACQCNGGPPCGSSNQTCCPVGTNNVGGCFDLSNGPEHCGQCANPACPVGQTCQMGSCVATSCPTTCTNGNSCVNGACTCKGAPVAVTCQDPLYCCGAAGCVDRSSDPNNCGDCGQVCDGNDQCCGKCVQHDVNNCARCGDVCPSGGTCCQCSNNTWLCEMTPKCVCLGGGGG